MSGGSAGEGVSARPAQPPVLNANARARANRARGVGPADRYRLASQKADAVEALLLSEPTEVSPSSAALGQDCDRRIVCGQYPTPRSDVESSFSSQQFRSRVSQIVQSIRNGDSFQVNFAILFTFLTGIALGYLLAHRLKRWLFLVEAGIGLYGIGSMALMLRTVIWPG